MQTVNGFWIGELGHMEQLTMLSFLDNDAKFILWSYDTKIKNLPKNVILKNASDIMPYEQVFRYPTKMNTNFGQNSYVGTSEIFRFKLLYEVGGWWTDMDVTCLKSIELISEEYFFRTHGMLPTAGNIMKCPPKSQLMLNCYETAKEQINKNCQDWFLGMKILCDNIKKLKLDQFIQEDKCNLDQLKYVKPLIKGCEKIPENWIFIHWLNTIIDKNNYHPNSAFNQLLEKHNCKVEFKIF